MTSFALTEPQRRWLLRLGYPVLALFVFVMALHFTFPYERVSDSLLTWMRRHYDVTGATTHAGLFPGSFSLRDVNIRTRPQTEEEKATELTIDRISVDLGLFAAARKKIDVEVDVEVGEGELNAELERNLRTKQIEVWARAENLPMEVFEAFLTKITGGAPIKGTLDMPESTLIVPDGMWKAADGNFKITCEGCTFGGKGTKLRPSATGGQANPFASAGLTLPRALKLGDCKGELDIKKGKGKLSFSAKSDHGELRIDAEITFMDPVQRSTVEGFIKFRFSDKIIAEDEKLDAMNSSTMAARLPDGFTGVRVFGEVGALRFKLSRVNPLERTPGAGGGDTGPGGVSGSPARPIAPTPQAAEAPPPMPSAEETVPPPLPPPPSGEDPTMMQIDASMGGNMKNFEPTRPIIRPELLDGKARVLPPAGEENVPPPPPEGEQPPPPPPPNDDVGGGTTEYR